MHYGGATMHYAGCTCGYCMWRRGTFGTSNGLKYATLPVDKMVEKTSILFPRGDDAHIHIHEDKSAQGRFQ